MPTQKTKEPRPAPGGDVYFCIYGKFFTKLGKREAKNVNTED